PLRIRSVRHPSNLGTYIYDHNSTRDTHIHAITHALGALIVGPSQSNIAEACNRLFSQYLSDDIYPTLQVETHTNAMLAYVAPTSANQNAFHNVILQLQNYDSGDDWQVSQVTVIAVVGNPTIEEHVKV